MNECNDLISRSIIEITNFDKNRGTVFYKTREKINSPFMR